MVMDMIEAGVAVTCGVTLSVLFNVASVKRATQRCEDRLERIERRLVDIDRRPPALDCIDTMPAIVAPTNVIPVDEEIKAWYDSLVTNPSAIPPPRVQEVLRDSLAESVREYRRMLAREYDEYREGATNISPYALLPGQVDEDRALEFYRRHEREGGK